MWTYIYIQAKIHKPLKKVLHIQFGGQYPPKYSIFYYMSYIIMEAWLSSFPMIPMNTSFRNGVGGPFCKVPNIHQCRHWTILLGVLLNLLCPVHTYRLTVLFALTLTTMIIITMIHTVTCHVCHLWIKPVPLCKCRQGLRKSGW